MIERSFPIGALEGLDAATEEKVKANNATVGVRWLHSLCIYEGPSEEAVRQAALLNQLPVDSVTEVPVVLLPDN